MLLTSYHSVLGKVSIKCTVFRRHLQNLLEFDIALILEADKRENPDFRYLFLVQHLT